MPPIKEGVAGDVDEIPVAGPRLLTDCKMDVLDKRGADIFAFWIIKHIIIDATIHFKGLAFIRKMQEIVGQ